MKVAVKPDFYSHFASLKKEEEAQKKGATEEERNLYHMSETSGWMIFTREVETLLKEMDALIEVSVSKGLSREEIGENTIVVSLAKGIIRRLMDKVTDSKEACEGQGGT